MLPWSTGLATGADADPPGSSLSRPPSSDASSLSSCGPASSLRIRAEGALTRGVLTRRSQGRHMGLRGRWGGAERT